MKISLNSGKDSQRQMSSLYSGTMAGEMGKWTGLQSGPALELHLPLDQMHLEMLLCSAQFTLTWTLSVLPLWADIFMAQQWHKPHMIPAMNEKGICRDEMEGVLTSSPSPSNPLVCLDQSGVVFKDVQFNKRYNKY